MVGAICPTHTGSWLDNREKKVEETEELATVNREKGISTILFFDEANTTEAIGLIKEVMCDRRAHGREISEDVNFIAACNPYRKSESLCVCVCFVTESMDQLCSLLQAYRRNDREARVCRSGLLREGYRDTTEAG